MRRTSSGCTIPNGSLSLWERVRVRNDGSLSLWERVRVRVLQRSSSTIHLGFLLAEGAQRTSQRVDAAERRFSSPGGRAHRTGAEPASAASCNRRVARPNHGTEGKAQGGHANG